MTKYDKKDAESRPFLLYIMMNESCYSKTILNNSSSSSILCSERKPTFS